MRPITGWRFAMPLLFVFWMGVLNHVKAQDITINNPSLEGEPHENSVPESWYKCDKSPDVQPGTCCGIKTPASDGKTYVGIVSSVTWAEGIAQKLTMPFKKGARYTMSFDLAYPPQYYDQEIKYGSLVIYGGRSAKDSAKVLWRSGKFYHTDWKHYVVEFTPDADYSYIQFWSYYKGTNKSELAGVLIDNFSEKIREMPRVRVRTKSTCKGENGGAAFLRVDGGVYPYEYSWLPGNSTGDSALNLKAGKYYITVKSANGTSATDSFEIRDYELSLQASLASPACYGNKSGEIRLAATDGFAPYKYSIDGGTSYKEDSIFKRMRAGHYTVAAKDALGCVTSLPVEVKQPDPVAIAAVKVTGVSCDGVRNGKIELAIVGGTAPYTYSVPGVLPDQADSVLRGLDVGHYTYLVEDYHGCTIDGDAQISQYWQDCSVFVPTAFSPNGDGKNDVFKVSVHDAVRDFRLAVYGRWGQLLFETRNTEQGWNGTVGGNYMPVGEYVYVVTYTDSKGQGMKHMGSLVMVR